MSDTKQFQKDVVINLDSLLRTKGYHDHVESSWYAFRHYGRRVYAPILDVAVGPFAVREGQDFINRYNQMIEEFSGIIDGWVNSFRENWRNYVGDAWQTEHSPNDHEDFLVSGANLNARCFLAIEIENYTTRKHQMGSLINAAALGRLGMFIAMQDNVLKSAIRMREYFKLLKEYGKPSFNMNNVVVLTKDQVMESFRLLKQKS